MKLKMITPDDILFDDNIESINIAEKEGAFSILKGHAPLITLTQNALATITIEGSEPIYIAANSGTLKVLNNEVSFIVDYGAVGYSKEEASANLADLREAMIEKTGTLGDDTVAKLGIQLMRLAQDL